VSRSVPRKPAVRLAREQRVDEILDAARQVFCQKGYEQTAMTEIAACLGVVEGTLYKYFASKRALLLAVLERWYEDLLTGYARDLAGISGPRQRLRLLIWRHLRAIHEAPQLCRLMFREVRSESRYKGSRLHAMNQRYTRFLLDVLQEGLDSGEFRGDLPLPLLRDLVYGGIEHYSWNYLCGHGRLDIDATTEAIAAILCNGIAARPVEADSARELRRLSRLATRIEQVLPRPVRTRA
jgi:AcrR family transcriptional regulator